MGCTPLRSEEICDIETMGEKIIKIID